MKTDNAMCKAIIVAFVARYLALRKIHTLACLINELNAHSEIRGIRLIKSQNEGIKHFPLLILENRTQKGSDTCLCVYVPVLCDKQACDNHARHMPESFFEFVFAVGAVVTPWCACVHGQVPGLVSEPTWPANCRLTFVFAG